MSATENSFVLTNPEVRIFSKTEGVYYIRLTLDDWWKSGGNTVGLAMQKEASARFITYDVEKYSVSGVAVPSTFLENAGKIKVWIGQDKDGESRISSTAELTVEDSTGRPDGVTIAVKTPAGSDEGCIEKIRESGGQFQFYGTQGWTDIKTSDETDTALNGKVDKIAGKGLSTNDYTDADKAEVAKLSDKVDKIAGKGLSTNDYTNSAKSLLEETVPQELDRIDAKITEVEANVYSNFKNKVDKVAGKGLSTNDYTDAEKIEVAKVAGKVDKPANIKEGLLGFNFAGVETIKEITDSGSSVELDALDIPNNKALKEYVAAKNVNFLSKPTSNGIVGYMSGIGSFSYTLNTSMPENPLHTGILSAKAVFDYINSLDAREVSY